MIRKRDRVDIILDMFATIQKKGGEIKPTHLMYGANLSYTQMNGYLEELMQKEMIQKIKKKDKEYFTITDKGAKFYQTLKEMKEFEKAFGL